MSGPAEAQRSPELHSRRRGEDGKRRDRRSREHGLDSGLHVVPFLWRSGAESDLGGRCDERKCEDCGRRACDLESNLHRDLRSWMGQGLLIRGAVATNASANTAAVVSVVWI